MAHKTILLKSGREGQPAQKELEATEAITPGMLCQYVAESSLLKIKKHATAQGPGPRLVAIENALMGSEIGTAYADGDRVQFITAGPGDELFMMLADDADIAIGDLLESNGAGYLQEYSEGTSIVETLQYPLFVALEAVKTTTSGSEAGTRIKVEAA